MSHTLDQTPWVLAGANLLAVNLVLLVGANHGEGLSGLEVSITLLALGIILGVSLDAVDTNLVELEVGENALLKGQLLLLREGVSLGNNGDDVHPLVEPLQELNIEGLQAGVCGE